MPATGNLNVELADDLVERVRVDITGGL